MIRKLRFHTNNQHLKLDEFHTRYLYVCHLCMPICITYLSATQPTGMVNISILCDLFACWYSQYLDHSLIFGVWVRFLIFLTDYHHRDNNFHIINKWQRAPQGWEESFYVLHRNSCWNIRQIAEFQKQPINRNVALILGAFYDGKFFEQQKSLRLYENIILLSATRSLLRTASLLMSPVISHENI